MSGRKLVLTDSPKLVLEKGNPMCLEIFNFRSLIQSNEGHESCKALIKPKVVPPFHGNQIAEPHMSKFVKICACKSESLGK